MNLFSAFRIADALHSGQVDLAGQPYVGHLARVVARVQQVSPSVSEEVLIAAVFHDTVEDGRATVAEMDLAGVSQRSLALVHLLTKRDDESYDHYLRNICMVEDARLIKLADVADNSDPMRLNLLPKATRDRLLYKYHAALLMLLA